MNAKSLVKLSNTIGIVAILSLIYWVFTFIAIEVFDFKVFKENITQTFYMSILGILALMLGALIINIMFNLTRIAQKHNQDESSYKKLPKALTGVFLASFPIIFIFLYTGDLLTSQRKEKVLLQTATSMANDYQKNLDELASYTFDSTWIANTKNTVSILSKIDEGFPMITLIVKDEIEGKPVFLEFSDTYYSPANDSVTFIKKDFILKTSKKERDYLHQVFKGETTETYFSAHDGHYELFYPYTKGEQKMLLYFSDRQRYGKIGR